MIKNVLVEVRERNLSRAASAADTSTSTSAEASSSSAKKEEVEEAVKTEAKEEEVEEASLLPQNEEERLLSLDYVHGMTDEQAMKELESFKGVGPKSESACAHHSSLRSLRRYR